MWQDALYDADALTVNIGDLLALRTPSLRSVDAVVTPLAPPVGRRGGLDPVVTAPFIRERLDAISVG